MIEPDGASWPEPPEKLVSKLVGQKKVKLQLVTPGIFEQGWKPGWAGGSPPGLNGLEFRLISAAVDRRVAVSGWDYKKKCPKAARWLAPAGSVYFFETDETLEENHIKALWLTSVSDNEQDRRDGFGIVVPGKWDYAE